jgi:hypothetical protein
MPDSNKQVTKKLSNTLDQIILNPSKKFSGIGIIVYYNGFLESQRYISLRPNDSPRKNLYLDTKKGLDYLLEISKTDNLLHDGYIFTDNSGLITHIAQYIEIRLDNVKEVTPHELHGTRYLSSLIVSKMKGVAAVGNVSSNYKKYIFKEGKVGRT